jgi:hypothetical protein
MAKLTAKQRNAMKKTTFAVPAERKYPVNDRAHAQNALARVAQHGTSAEKTAVRKKVAAKYPGMGKGKK